MPKTVAVLIDGGFAYNKVKGLLGRFPRAEDVVDFAKACLAPDEELFRIYYYDCPPYDGTQTNPISGIPTDFKATPAYMGISNFQRNLATSNFIAFRPGFLSFDGWVLSSDAVKDLTKAPRPLTAGDFRPDIKQKGVDIKIGLDVAWLSSKRIVQKLIMVVGDSDFIPAMKFGRQEGMQIVLVPMGHFIKKELRFHSDEVRDVKWPPAPTP